MAILNLTRDYGESELEAACSYALKKTSRPRYRFLRSVLSSKAATQSNTEPKHEETGYVRGAAYYAGGSR